MRTLRLVQSSFDDAAGVHARIADELGFPGYYGANLDALFDCLGEVCEPVRVELVRDGGGLDDDWFGRLAATFEDAAAENPAIEVALLDSAPGAAAPDPTDLIDRIDESYSTDTDQGGSMTDDLQLSPFARGEENPYGQFFVGKSYLNMLVTEGCPIGNVTFEPGCRNNWHVHLSKSGGGQILLVTGGRGWYQQWGMPARELAAGDVVVIPPNTKHWHGAARDSWFCHLAVEVPGEGCSNEWLEPVSDDDYDLLP